MSIHLDDMASSPVDPRVLAHFVEVAMEPGNPNATGHAHGRRAAWRMHEASELIADSLGAGADELVCTSGATESLDLAHLGLADSLIRSGCAHVVSTRIEHPATRRCLRELERRGCSVTEIAPGRDGVVPARSIAAALRADTGLVSVMHVNNETGAIQPIEAIADALQGHDAVLHIDAAQSFGKLQTALGHPRLDAVSFSGHKLHAPVGIGGLLLRDRVRGRYSGRLAPGPGSLRHGTPPVALWCALAMALQLALDEGQDRRERWRQHRRDALHALEPLGAVPTASLAHCLENVLSVVLPGRESELVVDALSPYASIGTGSACRLSGTPSHVLEAMGLDAMQAACTLRLSWTHRTPAPDWQTLAAAIVTVPALVAA